MDSGSLPPVTQSLGFTARSSIAMLTTWSGLEYPEF